MVNDTSFFFFFREVTTDLKAFDVQMAAKLTAPIFPSLGNQYVLCSLTVPSTNE